MNNFKPRYDYWDRKSKYAKAMSPGEVLPEIKEYVNAELKGFDSKDVGIYVGITGDPDKRFKAHQNKIVADGYTEWDEMVVVYCSSLGDVIQVENAMINYFNRSHAP